MTNEEPKKDETPVVHLTETQRIAIRNTLALKDVAMQRAAKPFNDELNVITVAAATAAGHDPKRNWRLSQDGKALLADPK